MAAVARLTKWTDKISCLQILNAMVILGFMFNYMLRVNMTIAIVAMAPAHSPEPNKTFSAILNDSDAWMHSDTRFNWSEAQKNDILGSFFWGYILTELPGGRLSELCGARAVFGSGMLLASLCTLITPLACHTHYNVALFVRALLGFFLGATWPSILPLAASWIEPTSRSQFMSNMMASSLGAALTMPACGYLIAAFGWQSAFYATGAVGVIWAIAWFALVYDSPAVHPRISVHERRAIEARIASAASDNVNAPKPIDAGMTKTTAVPWCAILTSAPVWAIILTHACSVFCYFTVVNQLPTYMDHVLQFNIKHNGWLSSLPYLGKYVMAVCAAQVADHLIRQNRFTLTNVRKMATAFAVLTPGLLMVLQALFGYDAIVSVSVFTLSLFFNGAVTAGYLANGLDIAPRFAGTIFGMANTLSSMGGWLSTKIVGVLTTTTFIHNNMTGSIETVATFKQWQPVFWILVAAYVCGAVAFSVMGSGVLQPWNDGRAPSTTKVGPSKGGASDADDLKKVESQHF